jgi:hypothetical protein
MARVAALLLFAVAASAQHPSAEIRNELIELKLWLPDPENGYYRGTRFDWSGAISSLKFAGHEYFGEWQKSDDPYLHDRITGPVEEYRPLGRRLGYDQAEEGGSFVRIGVGVCEKPKEDDYRWSHSYRVTDPGRRRMAKGANWIELEHEVMDEASGYGYRLVKRLTLTPGRPELVLDHVLVNTGREKIETEVYNHNFFVIDGQPTGPDFTVRFPFEATPDRDLKGYATVDGAVLRYDKPLPAGESIIALLAGFGADDASDHAFVIENRAVKAGVRMQADKPLVKFQFWSPRTTLCPEPFIGIALEPGQADRWTLRYQFFETP